LINHTKRLYFDRHCRGSEGRGTEFARELLEKWQRKFIVLNQNCDNLAGFLKEQKIFAEEYVLGSEQRVFKTGLKTMKRDAQIASDRLDNLPFNDNDATINITMKIVIAIATPFSVPASTKSF
jgi:hypothetical protein